MFYLLLKWLNPLGGTRVLGCWKTGNKKVTSLMTHFPNVVITWRIKKRNNIFWQEKRASFKNSGRSCVGKHTGVILWKWAVPVVDGNIRVVFYLLLHIYEGTAKGCVSASKTYIIVVRNCGCFGRVLMFTVRDLPERGPTLSLLYQLTFKWCKYDGKVDGHAMFLTGN